MVALVLAARLGALPCPRRLPQRKPRPRRPPALSRQAARPWQRLAPGILCASPSPPPPAGEEGGEEERGFDGSAQAVPGAVGTALGWPEVPWGGWFATKVMLRYIALSVGLGFLALPLLASALGTTLADLPSGDKARFALGLQVTEATLVWRMVSGALEPYPPPQGRGGWIAYDWGDARAWKLGGAGAVVATLAVSTLSLVAGAAGAAGAVGAVGATEGSATGPLLEMLGGGDVATALCLMASGVVVAPLIEESMYRGFLLPTLAKRLPAPAAVAACSACFAAAHLSVGDFPRLLALGGVLGATAVAAKGNMVAPLVAHAGYNGVIYAALLLEALGMGGN